MTWVVESPWPAIVFGVATELVLALWLVRSGSKSALAAMSAVAAIVVGLVVLERLVVTDAEAVEDTLELARRRLESNDAPGLLDLFTSNSPRRSEVQSILSHIRVTEARIAGDMELVFDPVDSPASATATFTARVQARDTRGQIPYENFLGRLRVTLKRVGADWRIDDYAQSDLRGPGGGPAGSPGNRRPR